MTTEITTQRKVSHGEQQARAQMGSISDMVARLEHCDECKGDQDCELTDAEIFAGINVWYQEGMTASDDDREQYHNADEAREAIEQDALSVGVRSGWYTPSGEPEDRQAEEYMILLSTGGPACRIIGELDRGEPSTARLEHQDWFTPWQELFEVDHEALLAYARVFYYGE